MITVLVWESESDALLAVWADELWRTEGEEGCKKRERRTDLFAIAVWAGSAMVDAMDAAVTLAVDLCDLAGLEREVSGRQEAGDGAERTYDDIMLERRKKKRELALADRRGTREGERRAIRTPHPYLVPSLIDRSARGQAERERTYVM